VLFDPRPKEFRSELFDREKELKELESYVKSGSPLILCLGVRRIGKTSLLKVFLNEHGYPHVYINARKLSEYGYSVSGLYRASPRQSSADSCN
jgi:AAA+ ATPase superfamily predicted ATPase